MIDIGQMSESIWQREVRFDSLKRDRKFGTVAAQRVNYVPLRQEPAAKCSANESAADNENVRHDVQD